MKNMAVVALICTAALVLWFKLTETQDLPIAASDPINFIDIQSTLAAQQAQLDNLAQSVASLQRLIQNPVEDATADVLPTGSSQPRAGR